MRQELKKITDLTINDLLNKNIILPSTYFDKFNYHAKELEIDLDDEKFKHEINKIILEDYQAIENYMNLIASSATSLQESTKNATNAILNKDIDSLNDIYKKMLNLEKEVKNLNDKLFVDDITNTFNKKWIYKKFLNENALFQQNGICVLVDVIDYNYIQKEYGELLANNLLIFATKFIKQKLKGLSDGKYTLSCWTQGNGLASKYQLFVKQNGVEMTTDIKDDGWNRWHQTSIKNIEVKNGEVEIGFILNGRPDTWGSIDDIEFYVQK